MKDPRGTVLWSTEMGNGASFGVKAEQPGRYSVCMVDLSGKGGLVLVLVLVLVLLVLVLVLVLLVLVLVFMLVIVLVLMFG